MDRWHRIGAVTAFGAVMLGATVVLIDVEKTRPDTMLIERQDARHSVWGFTNTDQRIPPNRKPCKSGLAFDRYGDVHYLTEE